MTNHSTMMRSSNTTSKTGKPPPPIPPRPSKSLVAEALAKSRKLPPSQQSQCFYRECNNTRPVIYQSANVRFQSPPVAADKPSVNNNNIINKDNEVQIVLCNNNINNNIINKDVDVEDVDKNHVNTLIDEMFASVLNIPVEDGGGGVTVNNDYTSVIVISSDSSEGKSVKFDDQTNHELLIAELEKMKKDQAKILKRQRKPSMNIYDGVGADDNNTSENDVCDDTTRLSKMSSLHGLPPLPKSLSGFNLLENHHQYQDKPPTPVRSSSIRSAHYSPHSKTSLNATDAGGGSIGRKSTNNLDAQLAILRREMYSLRQLDLSLLSQLWSLNESIQDFRQILQDQEDRVLSPPSPSPTPSSADEGDEFYLSNSSISFRPAPPPPPIARKPSNASN